MHNFVHSFCYTFNRIWRYNMKELNKLKQELLIMKTENIKPNYSDFKKKKTIGFNSLVITQF